MDQSRKSVLGKRLLKSVNARAASRVQTQPFAYCPEQTLPQEPAVNVWLSWSVQANPMSLELTVPAAWAKMDEQPPLKCWKKKNFFSG